MNAGDRLHLSTLLKHGLGSEALAAQSERLDASSPRVAQTRARLAAAVAAERVAASH